MKKKREIEYIGIIRKLDDKRRITIPQEMLDYCDTDRFSLIQATIDGKKCIIVEALPHDVYRK